MLTGTQLDRSENSNYFVNLKAMKELIRTLPRRHHKYNDRLKNRGLSKLLIDVYVMAELNRKVMMQKYKDRGDMEKIEKIIEVVSEEMGTPIHKIKGDKRTQVESDARHNIAFIARMTTSITLKMIGKVLSSGIPKDHSTISHGCEKVVDKLKIKDEPYTHVFISIKNKLRLKYGIEFDTENWEKFPAWYKRLLEK